MGEWDLDSPGKQDSARGQAASPGTPSGGGPPPAARQGPTAQPDRPSSAAPKAEEGSQPVKSRARLSFVWLALVAVTLLVGIMAGFFIARSQTSGDEAALADANARLTEVKAALSRAEDRNWAYYREVEGLKEQLAQATPSTSPTAPPAPADTFGPGLYLVGEGIPAGTYDGVVLDGVGYWARLKGTDGAIASIIDNGLVKGPFVLTIEPADKAVELRGVTLTRH